MHNSVQCSREKILVRYLYQKQSSMGLIWGKVGAVSYNPTSTS